MVDIGFQIIYGIFSAIAGAIFYHMFDKYRQRRRIKQAIFREIESNREILENQLEKIKPSTEWHGKLSETYHLEAYQALRVNDPELFLQLKDKHPEIFELYSDFIHLNQLVDKTMTVGPISDSERSDFINDLENTKGNANSLLSDLEGRWFIHVLNSPVHNLERLD